MTKNTNSTRYYSHNQESSIAKALNGRVVANSGAIKFGAGDVIIDNADMLIEAKTCTSDKASFSIKKEWLDKIKMECFAKHQDNYVLAFNYGATESPNYFILDEVQFSKYLEFLEKEYYSNNEE